MLDKGTDIEHWSRVAAEWTAWARAQNHDEFGRTERRCLPSLDTALATLSTWDVASGGSRAFSRSAATG